MISVVTSVYNCEEFIEETIKSVCTQTFEDWEYIIIDDNSKDRSAEIIEKWCEKDNRIKFIRNSENQGQCKNLNTGIALSKGKYIARLDHDDILDPTRFEKQLHYMEDNPNTVLVGSRMNIWKAGEVFRNVASSPQNMSKEEVKIFLLAESPIPHSSFFIRKDTLIENNILYDTRFIYAEDYALISDLYKFGDIECLNEALITYRVFDEQFSNKVSAKLQSDEDAIIMHKLADAIEYPDTTIYRRAIDGELYTVDDYKNLKNFFIDYSLKLGIADSRNEIEKNRVMCLTYLYMCDRQIKKGFRNIFIYLLYGPVIKNCFFDIQFLAYMKHCIIGKRRK